MKKTYEVSYIKTQWFKLLFAATFFVLACVCVFSPAADTSTLDGVHQETETYFNFVTYFFSGLFWAIMSFVDYSDKCREKMNEHISDLEARLEAIEFRTITYLTYLNKIKISGNNYMERRRLRPDSAVSYSEEDYEN